MRNLDSYLKNRKIVYSKLEKYGFKKEDDIYTYVKKVLDNEFEVTITVQNVNANSKIVDLISNDEYQLVDIEEAVGEFVGKVKAAYDQVLNDFISKCTVSEVFKSNQAKEIIRYVSEKYGDELEFLWEKFDDNAIWRNKENQKWYGIILTIKEDRLGIDSEKEVEVLDLRYQKDRINEIVDNIEVYPGYHMNKNSWITIKLDDTVNMDKIISLLDNSYKLSLGEKKAQKVEELSKKVYEYLKTIPKGKVVTYKQVAEFLGNKGLARIVGTILHNNPDGDEYPCYKVLNSKGELADAFVFGGKEIQKERLEKEGIEVVEYKVDLDKYQWKNK